MKKLIGLMLGFFLCSGALSEEGDFRCFQSVGLEKPLRLQFDFPPGDQKTGYVTYESGSGKIPVENTGMKETRMEPGRPSEFEVEWEEVAANDSGGKYVIVSQGARVYEFKYIRRDGKLFEFEEDLDSLGENGCAWNRQ
ncbi:hypothetical protein [Microbulbifer halophilus]|uniref:Uncharacterized protein n=1 Tax=Microbulbifer halophilus TaxID=453963 RepID=A0ABW5EEI9_9GAMM|nr:hypothetical protein [Microbulbifer halophilus]MCW8127705.1 hypothetical protein [Microbulbifer halophilus]